MAHDHHILIVDDEAKIGKALGRILAREKLKFTFVEEAPKAMAMIKASDPPFSLIISDQRMPDIQGTELLEQARQSCPTTRRFLLTAHSDMETVLQAINTGAVHRFISKPWDNEKLMGHIRKALVHHEKKKEVDQLLKNAVQLNKKLYAMDQKLMEETQRDQATLEAIEKQISAAALGNAPTQAPALPTAPPPEVTEALKLQFKQKLEQNKDQPGPILDDLYGQCMMDLFKRFTLVANRNGFEMPLKTDEDNEPSQ